MTALKNHPKLWLSEPAAASLARFEAKYGVIPITSAGRTPAEQNELIRRFFVVRGPANRPPRLFQPARPAEASRHVRDGGRAIDTTGNGILLMHAHGEEYGFFFNFQYDKVHFEYEEAKDLHKGEGAGHAAGYSQTVANEQNFLNQARGEKLKVDGLAGNNFHAAVKRYQEFLKKNYKYNGKIDGIWGGGTQKFHAKYYADWTKPQVQSRPTLRRGNRGTQVRILQDRLNGRFPAYSKLARDSVFGPSVENVVKEFQSRAGLKPDGIVGAQTWKALGL